MDKKSERPRLGKKKPLSPKEAETYTGKTTIGGYRKVYQAGMK